MGADDKADSAKPVALVALTAKADEKNKKKGADTTGKGKEKRKTGAEAADNADDKVDNAKPADDKADNAKSADDKADSAKPVALTAKADEKNEKKGADTTGKGKEKTKTGAEAADNADDKVDNAKPAD